MGKNKVTVKDRKWRDLLKRMVPVDKLRVHVGVLASKGGDAVHKPRDGSKGSITLLEIAAIHEFGSPAANIPERSFIRASFAEGSEGAEEMGILSERIAKTLVTTDRITIQQGLDMLGMRAVTIMRDRIINHIPPPNAPATIEKKGSSTPLIDTSQLINSLTYEIRRRED